MDDGSSVPPDWKRYLNVQLTIMQTRNGDWDAFENIVALAVRNNMKMSVWWKDLYRRLRLTSHSWTSWLIVQGFNFNPGHRSEHISAEHDRTFQYSQRTGWCRCGGLWRIKLLWLNSVVPSCSRWRCSLNWETDGGLPTLLMNMFLGS